MTYRYMLCLGGLLSDDDLRHLRQFFKERLGMDEIPLIWRLDNDRILAMAGEVMKEQRRKKRGSK